MRNMSAEPCGPQSKHLQQTQPQVDEMVCASPEHDRKADERASQPIKDVQSKKGPSGVAELPSVAKKRKQNDAGTYMLQVRGKHNFELLQKINAAFELTAHLQPQTESQRQYKPKHGVTDDVNCSNSDTSKSSTLTTGSHGHSHVYEISSENQEDIVTTATSSGSPRLEVMDVGTHHCEGEH